MRTDDVKSKLESAGFEIVAVETVSKKKFDSIVFTNDYLKGLANKPGRCFLAGALHVLVDTWWICRDHDGIGYRDKRC